MQDLNTSWEFSLWVKLQEYSLYLHHRQKMLFNVGASLRKERKKEKKITISRTNKIQVADINVPERFCSLFVCCN